MSTHLEKVCCNTTPTLSHSFSGLRQGVRALFAESGRLLSALGLSISARRRPMRVACVVLVQPYLLQQQHIQSLTQPLPSHSITGRPTFWRCPSGVAPKAHKDSAASRSSSAPLHSSQERNISKIFPHFFTLFHGAVNCARRRTRQANTKVLTSVFAPKSTLMQQVTPPRCVRRAVECPDFRVWHKKSKLRSVPVRLLPQTQIVFDTGSMYSTVGRMLRRLSPSRQPRASCGASTTRSKKGGSEAREMTKNSKS
jgi:hypothetical protein